MRDLIRLMIAWLVVCFVADVLFLIVGRVFGTPPQAPPIPPPQAPEVRSADPLADHHCPRCGLGPWTVVRRQTATQHSHLCEKCGNEFWHANPDPCSD